jgi:hypothetical protein
VPASRHADQAAQQDHTGEGADDLPATTP